MHNFRALSVKLPDVRLSLDNTKNNATMACFHNLLSCKLYLHCHAEETKELTWSTKYIAISQFAL